MLDKTLAGKVALVTGSTSGVGRATALSFARLRREEATLRARALELLCGVGLGHVIERRASRLEHAEQRFLEIARGLVGRPRFMLLDEPAGGLTGAEIEHLGTVVRVMRDCGIGVLLVEHHTDFVFRICDRVTTLDLGRMIKHGTPAEVRARHRVMPSQWADYRALCGDPADEIPGVRGIGAKTAAALLDGGLTLDTLADSGRLTTGRGRIVAQQLDIALKWREAYSSSFACGSPSG